MTAVEQSPMVRIFERLVDELGAAAAREALEEGIRALTNLELAALGHQWEGAWGRPGQLPPVGAWLVWFFLTGRGWGKTMAIAKAITAMVERGEVLKIGMAAQNEEKTYAVNVCSLIDAAPPRFVPEWIDNESKLVWPNGAEAFAYTPEKPANIRSENLGLSWLSEFQSWPVATRDEAYLNFGFATRKGKAQMIIDATPKRGHPLLLRLLKSAERDPETYRVVRGSMRENYAHLAPAAVLKLLEEFAGTTAGEEELEGNMLTDDEAATVALAVIEKHRAAMPDLFRRRLISIDPAVTSRKGSDRTGLLDLGLGSDGRGYVLGDYSGKHAPEAWASLTIDLYLSGRCDCVVVETNKGGDLLTRNLRAEAGPRGISVVVLAKDSPILPHNPRVIYVREVFGRGEKSDRARPISTAYERGRVSHVGKLASLEQTLTTWVPSPHALSPGDLDALVHGLVELLGLAEAREDQTGEAVAAGELQKLLMRSASQQVVQPAGLALLVSPGSYRRGL